ncbi:MAG: hypothetical protein AAFU79_17800 [Myxococcota bacterium]
MVMSCLVEPLVPPLVGRGASARPGRTRLRASGLAKTALLMSAVMAVGGVSAEASARALDEAPKHAVKSPHKRPAPIPLRDVAKVFGKLKTFLREEETPRMARPGLAPRFEWDAVWASRLRHAVDVGRDPGGCGLGRGRRSDRLGRSRSTTFLRFGSGEFRSGPSSPIFA